MLCILSEQPAAIQQANHNNCHEESRCKSEGYVMSKKLLTEARAIHYQLQCDENLIKNS